MYILCILIMAPAECHDFLQSLYQLSLIVRKVRKKLLNNKPFFKQKCRMKKYFWLKFLKSAFCHGFLAFVGINFYRDGCTLQVGRCPPCPILQHPALLNSVGLIEEALGVARHHVGHEASL